MSQLRQNKITKAVSKMNLPPGQVNEELLACYLSEVSFRGREFVFPEALSSQIHFVVNWLTNPQAKPWLMLCGACGNGKSTMVKALKQLFKLRPIIDSQDGKPMGLVIVDAKTISEYCRKEDCAFLEMKKKPMLAIDDLGIEPLEVQSFGNIYTPLIDLLTERYEEQRITIITSNLTPEQIRAQYGDRIADRLNEMVEKLGYYNDSYR